MLSVSVSVGDKDWQNWMDAVANTTNIRSIELSAELFSSETEVLSLVDDYGLDITHVRDVIPPDVSRYLFESQEPVREEIARETILLIHSIEERQVEQFSLEVGLDRVKPKDVETELDKRVKFLRRLIAAGHEGTVLCLAARHPRNFPASKGWEYAGNLLHDVMHPNCRLRVDLFPAELESGYSVEKTVSSFYLHTGVVRLHWQPGLGEDLAMIRAGEWLSVLQKHGFRGAFVFCPSGVVGEEKIASICRRIDSFMTDLNAAARPG